MQKLSKLFITLAVGFAASSAFAGFEGCPQFFAKGASPRVNQAPAQLRELCFTNFAVLHSGQSKTPVFSAEKLSRTTLDDAHLERTDKFYEEARLPRAERAQLADYKSFDALNQHYDRGHMSPAADQNTPEAMAQSFSLANMVPQAPENNRKAWAGLEKATRSYVKRASGDVFVITGPVYETPVQTLGPGKVWIPKYLYKLVYDASSGRAWAHWLANTNEARPSRPITYAELVRRTGIEFLPGVSPKD